MKKLIIVLLAFCTAVAAIAQQVEIYPETGPQAEGLESLLVRFSPDRKWILTNKGIWDAETGRELKRPYNTRIIGWSPDMKRYLHRLGSSIRVRNWETDAEICTIEKITANKNNILPLFSPDGNQVAAVTSDGKKIKISNALNGQELITIDGWEGGISRFCYNADGKNIILASNESVKIFDIANKKQLSSFSVKVTEGAYEESILSPNGKLYIVPYATGSVGNSKGFIKIFDTVTGKELYTLSGHNRFLTALACSYDEKKIISADRDNIIKTWDVKTGKELSSFAIKNDFITSMNYSIDNRKIVYGYGLGDFANFIILDAGNYRELLTIKKLYQIDNVNYIINEKQAIVQTYKTISLWDTEAGRRIWSIPVQNYDFERQIYLSNDKRLFAKTDPTTNDNQGVNNISIYDTATGKQIRTWPNLRKVETNKIIWNADGKELTTFNYFFFGKNFNFIHFWKVENGRIISDYEHNPIPLSEKTRLSTLGNYFNPDTSRIAYLFEDSLQIYETRGTRKLVTITGSFKKEVKWSPNSSRILTTSSDGTVKQWNAEDGKQLPGSVKHENLTAVEYSPDGKQFATGGNDKYVRVWNAENGAKLWEKEFYYGVNAISYSADGKKIIVNVSADLNILDATNGNVLFSKSEKIASISPDGKWVITASWYGSVRIWNLESGIEKANLISFDDGEWLAVTPDGYYNASAKGDQYLNARVGNTVTGIDKYRSTFNKPAVVQARLSNSGRMAHKDSITSVAVNPGGTRIASVSLDKTIKLWDLESGKELRTISNIGGSVNTISFSPNGKTLIHGAEDKTIRIWDVETGKAIRTINGHTDYVNEARYSPDGKRIASCADDKLIKIWDAESGKEIRTLSGHTDMVGVIAWSPDGKRLASGTIEQEKTIKIWDADNGRVLQTISGQGGRVRGIAYSPDGKKLASCTMEEPVVKIWDANSGKLLKSISLEETKPISLAWSPDGKRILVGSFDDSSGYIDIFDAETGIQVNDIWPWGVPQSLTWTPDGRRLITACNLNDAKIIKVFDALSGKEL